MSLTFNKLQILPHTDVTLTRAWAVQWPPNRWGDCSWCFWQLVPRFLGIYRDANFDVRNCAGVTL